MLYFYHGQEDFLIELELQKLKEKIVDKAFMATNYRTYDNPKFQELMDVLRTPSLMFGNVLEHFGNLRHVKICKTCVSSLNALFQGTEVVKIVSQ